MPKKISVNISLVLFFCLVLLLLIPPVVSADLLLEGRLLSRGREKATDKIVTLTLKIYDDEFGGRIICKEEQKITGSRNISMTIGRGCSPQNQVGGDLKPEDLWLEVTVNNKIMNPRLNLAALDTTTELTSASGWTMAEAGLRGGGVEHSTLTIDRDGITLGEIKAPLIIQGNIPDNATISAVNGSNTGHGIHGKATGSAGHGVHGEATGSNSHGVYGESSGNYAAGIFGSATGSNGRGVFGNASQTGNGTNFGGFFTAAGDNGRGVYGGSTSIANETNYGGYFSANGLTGRGVYGIASGASARGVFGKATGDNGRGVHGEGTGANGIGVVGKGNAYDFYADPSGGISTNFGPFTGAHDVRLAIGDEENEIRPGMIVVCSGQVAVMKLANGKASLSSTLPTVTLADKAEDKRILGVLVREYPLPVNHWYEGRKREGERFGIVNALGEGLVWISDMGGEIGVGDCITSSPLPGYGQLQNDDIIHSYTLGKATADVDWESVTETITYNGRKVKIYLIPVVYTSG